MSNELALAMRVATLEVEKRRLMIRVETLEALTEVALEHAEAGNHTLVQKLLWAATRKGDYVLDDDVHYALGRRFTEAVDAASKGSDSTGGEGAGT